MEKLKMHSPDLTDENIARILPDKCDAVLKKIAKALAGFAAAATGP